MMRVPVISLPQPHATLVALGIKQHLVMDLATDHRGMVLIHATNQEMTETGWNLIGSICRYNKAVRPLVSGNFDDFPSNAIIAKTKIIDCLSTTDFVPSDPIERMLDNYQVERWAWKLADTQPLLIEGIEAQEVDAQGFWYYDLPEVAA